MKSKTNVKGRIMLSITILLSIIMLIVAHDSRQTIKQLQYQVSNLKQKNYNDSTLLSEYQIGLDSFLHINPKAAEQFMHLIENENINE